MFFIRWLTTTPKGRQVAGPYFFIGVIFLIPFIGQAVGVVPRSTDAGLRIAIIALASLVAGIVELLPRTQRNIIVGGRFLSVAALMVVIIWIIMKLV